MSVTNFVKRHSIFFVIGAYIVLTLVFTTPVISKITTDIPGGGDAWQVLAKPYEVAKSFKIENTPDILKIISYSLHPLRFFNLYTHLLLLHLIFGEPLAYNILWLSSFILAAFGAYLLVKYLTKNKIAAFISGIIYSFAPIHFAYAMGFGGATHIEWIPFYVFFLLKYFHRPCIKNIILAGIFFAFVMSNEPHFAAYTLLFTVLIFIYYFITKRGLIKSRKFIKYTSIAGIIAVIFLAWQYSSLIKIATSENNYLNPGLDQATNYSTDLAAPFTPGYLHPFWGNFFQKNIAEKFTGNRGEYTIYVGYIVLFFALFGLIHRRKDKVIKFWAISAFLFFIFSLGPFLHFFGVIEPKIPMPYLFLYRYVPFFNNIRAVGRMFIIAMLCISVLAGFGIKYFLERYTSTRSKLKLIISILIIGVIIFEFWSVPFTSALEIPFFYNNLIKEHDDYKIIQIPIATSYGFNAKSRYYNGLHNKETIGGMDTARKIPGHWDFERNTPVISELLYSLPDKGESQADIITHPFSKIGTDILNYYNVKYLILHKDFAGRKELKLKNFVSLMNFIENNLEASKIFEDNKTLVYQINKKINPNPYFLILGNGWSDISVDKEGNKTRWAKSDATLKFINLTDEPKEIYLDFFVQTKKSFRRLEIFVNEELENSFIAIPKKQSIRLHLQNLRPGENIIRFNVYDQMNKLIKGEEEKPGVLFSGISYEEFKTIDSKILSQLHSELLATKENITILQTPVYVDYGFREMDRNNNIKIMDYKDFIREEDKTNDTKIFMKKNKVLLGNNLPLIKELLFKEAISKEIDFSHDIFLENYYQEMIQQIVNYFNIKYVILYKQFIEPEDLFALKKFLRNNLSIKNWFEDNKLLVLDINNKIISEKPILAIQDKWRFLFKKNIHHQIRKAFNDATLILLNPSNSEKDIKFSFRSFTCDRKKPRFLRIYFNNNLIKTISVTREHNFFEIDLKNVKVGENIITLKFFDENGQYIDTEKDRNICTAKFTDLKAEFIR